MKLVILLLSLSLISWGKYSECLSYVPREEIIMENISPHITYLDSIKSHEAIRHGIENIPNDTNLVAMRLVALSCFEPIRNHFNIPIGISSFFRCPELNEKIGGSDKSQHCLGEAIDIDADMYGGVTNKEIYDWAKENLIYDQIIKEHPDKDGNPAWVHISFKQGLNRNQCLIAKKEKSKDGKIKTVYLFDPL